MTDQSIDHMSGEPEYWFCLKHHTVEGREGCKAKDRLGPYASRQEAEHALQKVAERNEEWDEESGDD
jgi:hypothetical protein